MPPEALHGWDLLIDKLPSILTQVTLTLTTIFGGIAAVFSYLNNRKGNKLGDKLDEVKSDIKVGVDKVDEVKVDLRVNTKETVAAKEAARSADEKATGTAEVIVNKLDNQLEQTNGIVSRKVEQARELGRQEMLAGQVSNNSNRLDSLEPKVEELVKGHQELIDGHRDIQRTLQQVLTAVKK